MGIGYRLVYQDEESKQLAPMEEGDDSEDRRPWQSPKRAFLCPTALGKSVCVCVKGVPG